MKNIPPANINSTPAPPAPVDQEAFNRAENRASQKAGEANAKREQERQRAFRSGKK